MKTDLLQSCGHCWVFQIFWRIECSTFTALSFKIWNSSAGISSPPLALFLVMLSKTHLTYHSTMFGSRWMNTPLILSKSLRTFLYCSSVYSCHLFLISSALLAPYHFCPLLCPSLHEMLFSFAFHFFQLFVRPPQTTILPFWISFFWGWFWSLPPVQCSDKIWCTGEGNGKPFQHLALRIPWMFFHCYNISNFFWLPFMTVTKFTTISSVQFFFLSFIALI